MIIIKMREAHAFVYNYNSSTESKLTKTSTNVYFRNHYHL